MPAPAIANLADLRASGWRSRSVKDELRANFTAALVRGGELFPGIVGYDDTVLPSIANAILAGHDMLFLGEKGQGKSRIMRLLPTLNSRTHYHRPIADTPFEPRQCSHSFEPRVQACRASCFRCCCRFLCLGSSYGRQ